MKNKLIVLLLISLMLCGCGNKLVDSQINWDSVMSTQKQVCFDYLKSLDNMGITDEEYNRVCQEFIEAKDIVYNNNKENIQYIENITNELLDEVSLMSENNPKISDILNELSLTIIKQANVVSPNYQYSSDLKSINNAFVDALMKELVDTEDIVIKLANIDRYAPSFYIVNFYVNDTGKGTFVIDDDNNVLSLEMSAFSEINRSVRVDLVYASALSIIALNGFDNDNIDIEKYFDEIIDKMENNNGKEIVTLDNLEIEITSNSLNISYKDNTISI
ncbi:hypothetical protein [Mycoplasma sp. P36-A1]|uniref:hypothetical protein n=1 Tax=Mycoplasma sp. P36-A1 TaxID=3252900 RepID=UPI003C2CD251